MSKTIAALYDTISHASAAVHELEQHPNFTAQDMSVISQNNDRRYSRYLDELGFDEDATTIEQGAGAGATVGTAVGALVGLLAGTSMLALPGVGALVVLGPLGATLAGAGMGAAVGGLAGALIGYGVEHGDAQMYTEAVRRGASLVLVRAAEADVELAVSVLERHSPIDIEKRQEHWRKMGWGGFDEQGEPYTHEKLTEEYNSYPEEVRTYRPGQGVRHYGPRELFDTVDPALRDDFSNHYRENPPARTSPDASFNHADAYNIGAELARQEKYRKMQWEEAQAEVHRQWALKHDQRDEHWEEVKERVQYAWHRARATFHEKTM